MLSWCHRSAVFTKPWWAAPRVPVETTCVRVLAKQLWLQVEPLHDVLWHTQDRIHRLDLFISEQREACYSEESVKRVHLQGKKESGGLKRQGEISQHVTLIY